MITSLKKVSKLGISLISALLLTFTASCVNDNEDNGGKGADLKVGDALPHFEVTLSNCQKITTESLRGKVSVLVFFNTKCSDCQKELPEVQKVYDSYKSQAENLRPVIACIARAESAEEIEKYWTEHGLSLPYSAQPDAKVYKLFADKGIPLVYISDASLKIGRIFIDTDYPTPEMIAGAIEACR